MKKFLFGFLLKLWVLQAVFAQSDYSSKHSDYIDSLLFKAGITEKDFPAGILYDRAIPLAGLQRFKQTDTINRSYFLQAAHELNTASYVKAKHLETNELLNIANRYFYNNKLVPLGDSIQRVHPY